MTSAYWDESYPPEIYDDDDDGGGGGDGPVVTIPDATVQAGGPAVDQETTLTGDPDADIPDMYGHIRVTDGAALRDYLTLSMSWGTGTEDVMWTVFDGDLFGTYGPFTIQQAQQGVSINTITADAGAPAGTWQCHTDIKGGGAGDPVITADDWTLTVTAAEAPPATGATAGTPGTFTPEGAEPPATGNPGMLTLIPDPVTAWTTGQYVVAGDGTEWFNDGEAWGEGRAP